MAFVYSLAFALATLVLGGAVYYAAHAAFARQLDASIEQAADGLMPDYRDDGISGLVEAVDQREKRGPDALAYAVFDPHGGRIGGQLELSMPQPGWRKIVFRDPVEGPDPARALVRALPGGYRVVVAADLEPLEQIDDTILTLFGIAFAALLLIGLAGALLLGSYLRRRLARIEATASGIVAGDLSRRTKLGPRNDEFDRVAASLNAMLDRISGLVANLRQVTSDLAHDLRTPLARLRNQLEGLNRTIDPTERRAAVDAAVEGADEVLRLFEAILRISELEEGSLRRGFARVDLCRLLGELGETHVALAEDVDKSLSTDAADHCFAEGDRELIAQALINLIENALRHTPPGAAIIVGARTEGDSVIAFVRDSGPGIPAGERQRVLERFVRLEASRSTPGHGLGLSLVSAIARAHDAELTLTNDESGFDVAMRFRRA